MKKKCMRGNPNNYVTTLKAKTILPEGFDMSIFQKYSKAGSRKTYYLISDLEPYKSEILPANSETESHPVVTESTEPKPKAGLDDWLVIAAYVDGSFNKNTGVYGSAVVLVAEGEIITTATSSGTEMNSMRNVAGEISAAMLAVEQAEQFMPDELIIKYDYEGVGKWPTGEWKTKNQSTFDYAKFMRKSRPFKIRYEHVKAHSGDKYNEMADDLAIEAAGVKTMDNLIAPFTGERNGVTRQMRTIKYQVCASCLKDIDNFYTQEKHAFKDYAALKTHIADNLSKINNSNLFMDVLTHDEMMYITRNIIDKRHVLNALRWTVRGLSVEDAVKKAKVDEELYGVHV